jgi:5-aminolevulinate synthase
MTFMPVSQSQQAPMKCPFVNENRIETLQVLQAANLLGKTAKNCPHMQSNSLIHFDYNAFLQEKIAQRKSQGIFRTFNCMDKQVGLYPKVKWTNHDSFSSSKPVTVWCSNDYLGMGTHPSVIQAMKEALEKFGAGAGGSRNIGGTCSLHFELEQELASLHEKEAALLFSSCYVANESVLETLSSMFPNCVILSDADNHASMIHGIRHSRATKHIFFHNDMQHLRRILESIPQETPKIIALESVYSMCGSVAPLNEVLELAKEFGTITFLDEVHAVGMYGTEGAGLAQEMNLGGRFDIVSGTFGKAYGVSGGYIAASKSLVDVVRNFSPGFIFTTALSPVIAAGALASIQHLRKNSQERFMQRENVAYLKKLLHQTNIPFIQNQSHIVPIQVGNAEVASRITRILLQDYQIYAQCINYPTVPMGTERIRLVPGPLHNKSMTEQLVQALGEIFSNFKTLPISLSKRQRHNLII